MKNSICSFMAIPYVFETMNSNPFVSFVVSCLPARGALLATGLLLGAPALAGTLRYAGNTGG
jgi:hypothetical protein